MEHTSAGEWLRRELDRRGISVRDATDAVGLKATQAVYAWMSGKAAPTDEAAAKLADFLGVPEVEVRRRFGLWVPEEVPTDSGEPTADNPYSDPLERQIWETTDLPEEERRQWINLLRERRRATG